MKKGLILLSCLAVFMAVKASAYEQLSPESAKWLEAQTHIQTWQADFTQTRTLKSLTQPLVAHGHVWFAAPDRFRWELGHPPSTIAVRAPGELLIFYPRFKRVERFKLAGNQTGKWREGLSLLEAGFPRSREDLEARYDILSQGVSDGVGKIVLQPKSAGGRQMIPRIEIDFDTKDFHLRGTELAFADGSTMRNDFQNPVINPKIDESMFSPPIPSDYKVIEPGAGGGH